MPDHRYERNALPEINNQGAFASAGREFFFLPVAVVVWI